MKSDNIPLTLLFGMVENDNVKEWKLFGKPKSCKKLQKSSKKVLTFFEPCVIIYKSSALRTLKTDGHEP